MAIDSGEYQNLKVAAQVDAREKVSFIYTYIRKIMTLLISFQFMNLEGKPQS